MKKLDKTGIILHKVVAEISCGIMAVVGIISLTIIILAWMDKIF